MMERKEIVRYILLIICVVALFAIPWASVIGIQDKGLVETIALFQRIVGVGILTYIVVEIVSQIYGKSLAQELKEEEIREADQEDTQQSLFKPTIGVLVMYLFFISLPILDICTQLRDHKVDLGYTIVPIGFMVFWILAWYITPVFIFTEDSVQIKSFLFYFFRINRKTAIKYADITSVRPDPKFEGNYFGIDRRFRIEIFMNGTMKRNFLIFYNSDIVAKIYLRFREKLGDKVRLQ